MPLESTGYGPRDRRVTFAARAVLEAISKGQDAEALADEMVAAVLGQEAVLVALAAREKGPHRWRRVIELAGVILAADRAPGRVAGPGRVPAEVPQAPEGADGPIVAGFRGRW